MARTLALSLFLFLNIIVIAVKADIAAPAPAPSVDCTPALLSLADCLSYVEQGSNLTKPEGDCCSGLKKVVKEEPHCLCEAFAGGANLGIPLDINITKALSLPSVCKVQTPSPSKCNS
jgi:Probable lipid transfer